MTISNSINENPRQDLKVFGFVSYIIPKTLVISIEGKWLVRLLPGSPSASAVPRSLTGRHGKIATTQMTSLRRQYSLRGRMSYSLIVSVTMKRKGADGRRGRFAAAFWWWVPLFGQGVSTQGRAGNGVRSLANGVSRGITREDVQSKGHPRPPCNRRTRKMRPETGEICARRGYEMIA